MLGFIRFLIIVLLLTVRFYHLEALPGEWFGDISNVHEYVLDVVQLRWPFYFLQSPGPVYHYLIAPIALLFWQQGFLTYKIASVFVSALGLIVMWFFVREVSDRRTAWISMLVMGVSFWYLVWSRLGNSQVVIPVILLLWVYFFFRWIRTRKTIDIVVAILMSSLGWYTYPQTFIFPVLLGGMYMLTAAIGYRRYFRLSQLTIVISLLILTCIPFIWIVRNQPDLFGAGGYIGQKILPASALTPGDILSKTAGYYVKTLGLLHIYGDNSFRTNVARAPMLDPISGLLFFFGVLYFMWKGDRRIWWCVLLLFILPLPSISPVIPEGEIPSSSRSIAILPFVYLCITGGFLGVYLSIKRYVGRYSAVIGVAIVCMAMTFLNLQKYFVAYPDNLPDNNGAMGYAIARKIDTLPEATVYLSGCCWGTWGDPDHKEIAYALKKYRPFQMQSVVTTCADVPSLPAIVVIDPKNKDLQQIFQSCTTGTRKYPVFDANGIPAGMLIFIQKP